MRRPTLEFSIGLVAICLTLPAGCAPAAGPVVTPSAAPSSEPTTAPSVAPSVIPTETPVAPSATHRLAGAVIDINRDPLAGATVTVRRGEQVVETLKTAADGTYSVSLPAGTYEVTASHTGHTTRTRSAKLEADLSLSFGPTPDDQANPYFLADTPEVERVEVQEEAPGGPLTLRVHLSEPVTASSQKAFDDHFELRAGRSVEFLVSRPGGSNRLKTASSWEEDGKVYVFSYPGPYVASGPTDALYTVALEQEELETTNRETLEPNFEDLGIEDEAGNDLGRGRAAYAFVKPQIFPPSLEQLVDATWGFLVQDRRWRLSHDASFTFAARRDEAPPALSRVELEVEAAVGSRHFDVLTLRFTEPMSAAKDRDNLNYTRLSVDRPFVVLNVAADAAGKELKPLSSTLQPRDVIFDPLDPSIVYLHYPSNYFDKQTFIEVTLTPEALDPAGNKPDPENNRLLGRVVGG